MKFNVTGWGAILVICLIVFLSFAAFFGIADFFETKGAIKDWSMQESIFYGFLFLSFAVLVK